VRQYDQFAGKTTEELRFFLGANLEKRDSEVQIEQVVNGAAPPKSFSWLDKTNPKNVCVGAVRSQLDCGSCWAFSSTSTLADRACLVDQTLAGLVLAPEQMVLCDKNNDGCDGGSL